MASSNKCTRSSSLPTRSNALTIKVEEQLCRLRSSELATSSSSTISQNLAGLMDLYESVDELLQLQPAQHKIFVEAVLDASVILLDVSATIRDVLSQMKQCIQDLQSSIRRRTNDIGAYMTYRKKITKVIRMCLAGLKKMHNKNSEDAAMVSMLREVEATTVAVFESLLSFLSGSKAQKQSSWSLVSKLTNKRVLCEGETNEVDKADMALNALKQNKDVKSAQNPLEALEICIQDIEEGLECVFRGLIKTRVSLLNILNQ